ncbi:MAG: type VI secretion system protein TssA [Desulfovibrio sp.]|jgi:type VI secretion system protein VasJ|nr:type VI secretion system protein TssA [Desulfovibrio sp.]
MDETLSSLGAKPIPGPEPAGLDARYEPEYAAVLAEIEKLGFSGQGSALSWPEVEANTRAILADKSKDLQIAAYLAVALWQNRGVEGLLPGVQILDALLREYWQTAWPPLKRMRGRVNAVDWWHEKTNVYLQSLLEQNAALEAAYRQQLLDALQNLETQRSDLLPDALPLRDLLAAVGRLSAPASEDAAATPRDQTEKAAEPAVAAAPEKSAAKLVSASHSVPKVAASKATATEDLTALQRQFVDAGLNYLPPARRANPADPALWRLSRLIAWGGIAALPPLEEMRTFLPAPDLTQLDAAARLLESGKALESALAAEDMFVTAPFCLDIQRLIHKSLLAAGYAAAAGAVQEECARFTRRLPGVERLSFTDGTAFAAPETIAWLHAATTRQGGQEDDAGTRESSTTENPAWQEARKLQEQNDIAGALNALDAAKTFSPALNLRLRTEQLRILCDAGEEAAAVALAKTLLAETEERALDNWDPDLALETLLVVRQALTLFDAQNIAAPQGLQIRIARLKPASILKGVLF